MCVCVMLEIMYGLKKDKDVKGIISMVEAGILVALWVLYFILFIRVP